MYIFRTLAVITTCLSLIACGASDDNSGFVNYKIDPYLGGSVDNTTLTGTWVAVSSGVSSWLEGTEQRTFNDTRRIFFIVQPTEDGKYEHSRCRGDLPFSFEVDTENNLVSVANGFVEDQDENYLTLPIQANLIDNTSMKGSILVEGDDDLAQYEYRNQFEMVKYSDSTQPFGSVLINLDVADEAAASVNCFTQVKTSVDSQMFSSTDDGLHVELFVRSSGARLYIDTPVSYSFEEVEGEQVNYTVRTEEDFDYVMEYNAVNNQASSVVGNVEINLPH